MKGSAARAACLGLALTVAATVAACGGSSNSSWSTATSAASNGGMSALVSAAKAEGQLNVIALPLNWANYGSIIKDFAAKYGIKVNQANPQGSSQDEVNAVKSEAGTSNAPDVLDIGMAVAWANTSLFAPYEVSEWSDIPADQKDATGLWYQDYGGYMSIGYDSSKYTVTSVSDLLQPAFKSAVALNGDPTEANAALNGVMMASLANGGSLSNIGPGVTFFKQLNADGNFVPVTATAATIDNGTTPVVFDWDYLNSASVVNLPSLEGVRAIQCRAGWVLRPGDHQDGTPSRRRPAVGGVPLLCNRPEPLAAGWGPPRGDVRHAGQRHPQPDLRCGAAGRERVAGDP